jgi:D-glycero-D-manno-heptose 1,7-bisphosphate phosphatase
MIDMASLNAVHAHMLQLLQRAGGRIDAIFFCPHTADDDCDCRKPLPGMMKQIGQRYGVDLGGVHMAGDTARDLQAALAAGCQPHFVRTGRAGGLDDQQVERIVERAPGTVVHRDLRAFVDWLLHRERGQRGLDIEDSGPGGLA